MTLGTGMGSSTRRTITAFFDNRSDAEDAIDRLTGMGVSHDNVRLIPGYERDTDTGDSLPAQDTGEGFWDALRDLFLPEDDRRTYAEGLRRGGYLVTVDASDDQYERVLDILDDEGTIDMDERAGSWRSEGWTGSGLATSGATAGLTGEGSSLGAGTSDLGTGGTASTGGTSGFGIGRTGSASASDLASSDARARDEEVIPVAEEQLHVGKRDVSHGRVRVRSYVVETPVNEAVNLREERVHVERRPADRSLSDADNLFQERTIEAEERSEEAVVSKEARVKEELVIRKDVEQRTENVSDTVRSTKVEVEDERGNTVSRDGTTDRR